MPLEPFAYLTTLRADAERLAAAADGDPGLASPVPTCPDWTVRDLVVHIGRVHLWVNDMVRTRAEERGKFPPAPAEDAQVTAWFREGADQLVEALGNVDPEQKVWNWGDGTAKFWHRRQAQETAVHRWDAQHAVGDEQPIDASLAVDGIDELFDMLLPRYAAQEVGAGETLHLHATDRDGEWTVTFGAKGLSVETGHGKGDAAVRGTASDLLLFCWNRLPVEQLELFGDPAVASRWRELARV